MREGELLEKAGRITNIPGVIIQGRYDLACPPQTAWELHQKWTKAEFVVVPDAGHHSSEPGIIDKLIEYTDKFADL